ncbi:hypothetical protein ACSQ67_001855 [Phaseolus vulgaris]
MEQEIENISEKNAILQKEKVELLEKNKQLRTDVANGEKRDNASNSKSSGSACRIDRFEECLDLKDAMTVDEDEHSIIPQDVVALRNHNLVNESLVTKKVLEQKVLSQHLSSNLSRLNSDLNQELGVLRR